MSTFRSINSQYRRTATYHNDKAVKLVKKMLHAMRGTANVPKPATKTSLKSVKKADEKKKDSTKKGSVNQAVLLVENREKVEEKPQGFLVDHCVEKKRKADEFVDPEKAPKMTRTTVSFAKNNNSLSSSCEKSSITIGGKQSEKYELFEQKRRENIQKRREESRSKLEELEKSTVVTDDLDVELELMRLMGCKTRGWFIDYRELGSWHPTRMEKLPAFPFH